MRFPQGSCLTAFGYNACCEDTSSVHGTGVQEQSRRGESFRQPGQYRVYPGIGFVGVHVPGEQKFKKGFPWFSGKVIHLTKVKMGTAFHGGLTGQGQKAAEFFAGFLPASVVERPLYNLTEPAVFSPG